MTNAAQSFIDEPEHVGLLRDTLKRFVAERAPREKRRDWDKAHQFPRDVFAELAQLGICGLTIPEAHGGAGVDLMAAVAAIEELAQAGAFLAGPFIHAAFYGGANVVENGSDAQKAEMLPKLAAGEMFFAYGLSEPDVGGDLPNVKTRARMDGDEIVINEHFPELADTPEIAVVIKEADQKTNIGGGWHADHSYDPAPALGSILVARDVPECGGDTMFAHLARAFDTLSDGLKANLRSLRALHSSRQIYGPGGAYEGTDLKQVLKADGVLSDAMHPVVIRHPETGREVLYVNPAHTIRFEGWTREESLPLLNHLYAHATKPEFTCRHRWTPGCVAMWDNRSTWHHALNDYHGQRREMHRITIAGTPLDAA